MGPICFSQIHPSCRLVHRVQMHNEARAENKLALTYRLIYVQEGSIYYRFDGKRVLAREGDLLFFPPGQVYSTYQNSLDEQHISIYFSFLQGDHFDQISLSKQILFLGDCDHGNLFEKRTSITDTQVFDKAFHYENAVMLYPLLTQLLKEFNERNLQHRMTVNALLTQLLVQILRLREGNQGSKQYRMVEDMMSYINEHYTENLTCQSIAEHFHYHPNYINQLMKTAVGMNLHTYIANTKIHYANILLSQTSDSLSDIAEQLGFSSLSRFSGFYRSMTGISPSEWRKWQMSEDG